MADNRPHCPEHEKRTQTIAEHSACLAAIKRERDSQFQRMREIQEDIYDKLHSLEKGKVDMGTFKWIMSAVGVVAMMILVTLMAQVSTMSDVKADLRVITTEVKGSK